MSTKSAAEWRRTNDPLIAEFRASGGRPKRRKWPLLLLTTVGARTGTLLVTPLYYTADADRFVVVASNGGAARDPAWYHNLRANPDVTVEVGGESFAARATTTVGPERERLFGQHAAVMPFYEGFRKRMKARELPVVILERRACGAAALFLAGCAGRGLCRLRLGVVQAACAARVLVAYACVLYKAARAAGVPVSYEQRAYLARTRRPSCDFGGVIGTLASLLRLGVVNAGSRHTFRHGRVRPSGDRPESGRLSG